MVGHSVTQTLGPGSLTVIERRLLAPVVNIDPLLAEYPMTEIIARLY